MKKHQYLIFLCFVLCILAGSIWMIYFRSDSNDQLLIEFIDQEIFKVNDKVDPVTLVAGSNSTNILYPTIDTSTPGEKNLLYIAVDDTGKQKEFMKTIKVVSPIPPTLKLKQTVITISEGDDFMPADYIGECRDEFDGELKPVISGSYDCTKPGEYKIVYEVKNSSDLISKASLQLIVKNKVVESKPTAPTTNTQQSIPKNETEPPVSAPSTPSYAGKTKWLLEEGYDFNSAQSACMAAGRQTQAEYVCDVIYDEYGLGIGYQLIY